MTKSMIILVSLFLVAAVALLTSTAGAQCKNCGSENWDPMQKLDEVGDPAKQVQSATATWGPSVARETNSQFDRGTNKSATNESATNEAANSNSDTSSSATQTPALSIDLMNASAEPNSVSPGSPVKITAILGGNAVTASNANTTAYAILRNSVGVQVGNVTLEHTSGDEYAGTWTASIATGTYKATIDASASGVSRTFNDALKIDVNGSDNAADNSRYKKLG